MSYQIEKLPKAPVIVVTLMKPFDEQQEPEEIFKEVQRLTQDDMDEDGYLITTAGRWMCTLPIALRQWQQKVNAHSAA